MRSDGAYVITGGAGGLGVSVAEWLIKQGARDVLLLGRRGPDDAARAIEARLSSRGARVRVARCDVSDDASVRGLFEGLTREGVRVRGVIHAAGVLSDGIVHGQSRQRFRDVYAPKVRASWALHRAIEQLPPVDFLRGVLVRGERPRHARSVQLRRRERLHGRPHARPPLAAQTLAVDAMGPLGAGRARGAPGPRRATGAARPRGPSP